ncbi:MAG: glycosyltransferase family 2 protein [Kiritimatiellia bacterium]
MTDLAVVILTKNERLHIARCLEKLTRLGARQIFVVDCFSTDGTQAIARQHGATVVQREWPGLYAKQFNWALDNLPVEASWVLRLDADEYLYPDTIEEVKELLPKWNGKTLADGNLPKGIASLSLSRARVFCCRKIRFGGTAHIPMVRFFRYGIGRCEDRAMDEHIVTSEGSDYRLKGEFADDNLNTMDWWREKHRGYAKREAADALAFYRGEVHFKRSKELYYRQPPFLRAVIYFSIRYFLRLGFLDGYAGWMWHFWQGLWYRWLVDREIGFMKNGRRR